MFYQCWLHDQPTLCVEILIKHGHAAKLMQSKTISDLLARLHTLERQHKAQPDHATEAELVQLREAIREHFLYKATHVLLKI